MKSSLQRHYVNVLLWAGFAISGTYPEDRSLAESVVQRITDAADSELIEALHVGTISPWKEGPMQAEIEATALWMGTYKAQVSSALYKNFKIDAPIESWFLMFKIKDSEPETHIFRIAP